MAITVHLAALAATLAGPRGPGGLSLTYEVRNDTAAPIWLVSDGFLAWRQRGNHLELNYARVPLQPGVHPFGYFDPKVQLLSPGSRVLRSVQLTFPLRLDGLWNAQLEVAPAPGTYALAVRVGYGLTPAPEPDAPGSAEERVLAWQREAVSPARPVALPPHAVSP